MPLKKVRAEVSIVSIGGKPVEPDTILTVESDVDNSTLALLRWPGAPPVFVYWPDLERAVAMIARQEKA